VIGHRYMIYHKVQQYQQYQQHAKQHAKQQHIWPKGQVRMVLTHLPGLSNMCGIVELISGDLLLRPHAPASAATTDCRARSTAQPSAWYLHGT
jgi:hypothetical protein